MPEKYGKGTRSPSNSWTEYRWQQLKSTLLGCSSTTSITALRAELGVYSLKTNRDVRKLKWQYKARSPLKRTLPVIASNAVWEKVTKERAGPRWKDIIVGKQEGILAVHREARGAQDKSKRNDRKKRKASAKKQGERGETLQRYTVG